jgi:endonuclease YncB( thermonuclease family)
LFKTNVATYPALFRRVKETLLEGQRSIEAQKVQTYWEAGHHILAYLLDGRSRAVRNTEVIERLADDLGVDQTLLHRCVRFARAYPELPKVAGRQLMSWSHYRELIKISDDKERMSIEKDAAQSGWSSDELAARIKSARPEAEDAQTTATQPERVEVKPLVPLHGTFYTYRIVKRKAVGAAPELLVDLGFTAFKNVEAKLLSNFSDGDIVASVPKEDAYRFTKADRTEKDLYTYNAYVERVVDGDTLDVRLDVGFDMWIFQRLRLRGIDCPELKTKDGDAAKAYVQSLVKEADRVVVRSSRSDNWDRYLADVFIPKSGEDNSATDVFLNNLLMETGHAERWQE